MSEEIRKPIPPKDPRHHRFALNILNMMNRTEAYLQAGFKCTRHSASVGGHRLMRMPEIDAFISNSFALQYQQRQRGKC